MFYFEILRQVVNHLSGINNAVEMLQGRVKTISQYLDAVKKGEVPPNYEMLRKISSLCNRLPTVDSKKFYTAFQNVSENYIITPDVQMSAIYHYT